MVGGAQVVVRPEGVRPDRGHIGAQFLHDVFAEVLSVPAEAVFRDGTVGTDHMFDGRAVVNETGAVLALHILPVSDAVAELQGHADADFPELLRNFAERFGSLPVNFHGRESVIGGKPDFIAAAGMRGNFGNQGVNERRILLRPASESLSKHDDTSRMMDFPGENFFEKKFSPTSPVGRSRSPFKKL